MTYKIDIVRALRDPEYRAEVSEKLGGYYAYDVMNDAADEIERLRKALKE